MITVSRGKFFGKATDVHASAVAVSAMHNTAYLVEHGTYVVSTTPACFPISRRGGSNRLSKHVLPASAS